MLATSDAEVEAKSWIKYCKITGDDITHIELNPTVRRAVEKLLAISINLVTILDPYCQHCLVRSHILRLHDPDIHTDLESPDGLDDARQWSMIYAEELP